MHMMCISQMTNQLKVGDTKMTIDEAIKHAEEEAIEQHQLYSLCPVSDMQFCDGRSNCKTLKNGAGRGCLKCAEEQEQLAEWLKELKQLKKDQIAGNKMTFDELLKDAQSKEMSITELCKMLYDENTYLNQCVTIEHESADYWASEHDKLIERIKDLEQKLRQWKKYDI